MKLLQYVNIDVGRSVGNMGEEALKSHMKGQKHKDRTTKNSITSHFQPASSSKTAQTTINEVLIKDNILLAEIRWVLKIIESSGGRYPKMAKNKTNKTFC